MASEIPGLVEAENSGTAIEIKIKTMDSQTYTLRVDREMPVPALKESIASVTGVLTDHQRLLCRGKVLKDDQLLSAYHVEDGHTLHLVVREPAASSSDGLPVNSAFDHSSSGNRVQAFQVAPGIVVETFNMPGQGYRGLSDVSRIVSAVLGSMGIANTGSEMMGQQPLIPGSVADATQISPEQRGIRSSNDRPRLQNAFGIPTGASFGSVQAPVIPDALATLSRYLSRMREEFLNSGNAEENNDGSVSIQGNEGASTSSTQSENIFPTPALLAELLSTTCQMLNQAAEEYILQLARQLENQENLTDSADRENAQSGAIRCGIFLQSLGAYFLELGRTITTLRLGQSPSEAVVNAGPGVFISPSGPNPLMVQPLSFQPRASFGSLLPENPHSVSGLTSSLGAGFASRLVDIQIHRVAPPTAFGATQNIQTATGISDSPSNNGAGVRTMMAADSDVNRSTPEQSLLEILYSRLGRNPNVTSENSSGRIESQGAGDMHTRESTTFQQNVGVSGSGRAEDSRPEQRESVSSGTIEIDVISDRGISSGPNAEEQISADVLQLLSGLFPEHEFQIESVTSEGMGTEQVAVSGAVREEAEPRATEEGIFFSRMLQQLMPLVPGDAAHLGGDTSSQRDDPTSSAPVEGSRRRGDDDPALPNPKRQKKE